MAKFVLAGKADCPYYAKAELLADYLQKNLPNFRVHKITQHPDDWEPWLTKLCEKNGWKYKGSPIIWRELVNRGGKGLLLGGFNEFLEHAQEYYNITSAMVSTQMKTIAAENLESHIEIKKEQEEIQNKFNPLHVWITSASLPACYSLIPVLASGEVFGTNKEIWLHLLDNNQCTDALQALVMEAVDLAFPLLRKVTIHTITEDAFLQANYVIILDDVLTKEDESPEDYMKMVTKECAQYGCLIDQNANKDVKVIVAGTSYANLKALVIANKAPSIDQRNIVALSTQLELEAKAEIAKKLNIHSATVKDVIVWGNISGINHLDLNEAKLYLYDSSMWGPSNFSRPLLSMIHDRKWLKDDLVKEWNKRWEHRNGMSSAHSIARVLSWWQNDSNTNEIVSLGVISEGQFELPVGIVYSMPVQFQQGEWQVYKHVNITEEAKEALLQAANELIKEKAVALGVSEEEQTTPESKEYLPNGESVSFGTFLQEATSGQQSVCPSCSNEDTSTEPGEVLSAQPSVDDHLPTEGSTSDKPDSIS